RGRLALGQGQGRRRAPGPGPSRPSVGPPGPVPEGPRRARVSHWSAGAGAAGPPPPRPRVLRRPHCRAPTSFRARRRRLTVPVAVTSVHDRCSINGLVTASLHRFGYFFASTSWGLRSCPDSIHRRPWWGRIEPGQPVVDSWTSDLHRLWTTK